MSESDDTSTAENNDEREPEILDAVTGEPIDGEGGPNHRLDLANLRDVRLEMAAVYRMAKRGKMKSGEASKLVWMLRQIGDVIYLHEVEARVQELEDRQAAIQSGRLIEHRAGATAH